MKATRDSHREARRDDRRLTHACGRSQNSLRSCLLPPSCPAPPQSAAHRHLHSRLLTTAALLGWRRTLERPAGADRGAKAASRQTGDGRPPCGSAHDVGVDVADPAAARSRVPVRGTVLHTAALLCDPSNNLVAEKSHGPSNNLPAEAQLSTHTGRTDGSGMASDPRRWRLGDLRVLARYAACGLWGLGRGRWRETV